MSFPLAVRPFYTFHPSTDVSQIADLVTLGGFGGGFGGLKIQRGRK